MGKSKAEIRAWESRWAVPVGIATFLAVALLVASNFVNAASGDGQAEFLRSLDEHRGSALASGLMQTAAFLLFTAPLVYLFRAAQARSDRVRSQLIGLVVVAPLFLALSNGLSIEARSEAADQFLAGEAKAELTQEEAREECVEEREDEGGDFLVEEYEPAGGESPLRACETRKVEDDEAGNAIGESSLAGAVSGLGLAGGLGWVVSLFYSSLWAMRTGLLSRFWGSFGMVAGFAFLLGPLFLVALIWFVYFGFLLIGAVPGGKPPAWGAAEAIPWPTPGERAAAEMEPEDGWGEPGHEIDGEPEGGVAAPKRKRKQRE